MSTNECVKFVLHCLGLELFTKIKKRPGFYTLTEIRFIKIKKNHTPFCRYDGNVCKISAKILNSTVVGAGPSFKFFRQITWFLENKALPKFEDWIFHHFIRIIKLQNN